MVIKQKLGNLNTFHPGNRQIDRLPIQWYESKKRILHKKTVAGQEIVLKFMRENQNLTEDDIIFVDENVVIAVEILACDVIIIHPRNMFEMASVCYEIGNKHLPLFYDNDDVLIADETQIFSLLTAAGYDVQKGHRKLLNPLETSVTPHGDNRGRETLFSKIMNLSNQSS